MIEIRLMLLSILFLFSLKIFLQLFNQLQINRLYLINKFKPLMVKVILINLFVKIKVKIKFFKKKSSKIIKKKIKAKNL